jgi:hypothetical protein
MEMRIDEVAFPSREEQPVIIRGKLHTFDDGAKHALAVVCHPSSAGECDMEHLLVREPCRLLNEAGFITLRLNFRGVGGSGGELSRGRYEPTDLLGALDFLEDRDDIDWRAVYTVGHSFGGTMALKVGTEDPRVKGFAAMGCPIMLVSPIDSFYFRHYEVEVQALRSSSKHKLFLWGELDGYAPKEKQESFAALVPDPKTVYTVKGANHFLSEGKRVRPDPKMALEAATTIARQLSEWRDSDIRHSSLRTGALDDRLR